MRIFSDTRMANLVDEPVILAPEPAEEKSINLFPVAKLFTGIVLHNIFLSNRYVFLNI